MKETLKIFNLNAYDELQLRVNVVRSPLFEQVLFL